MAPVPHGVAVHKTYHAGERHVQQLAGVVNKADAVGAGHDHSADCHSVFFAASHRYPMGCFVVLSAAMYLRLRPLTHHCCRRTAEFIRTAMPEQHRAFWSLLPLFYVGTVDGGGRPWASVLAGRPGFVRGPDSHTLHISATPAFAGEESLFSLDTVPGCTMLFICF